MENRYQIGITNLNYHMIRMDKQNFKATNVQYSETPFPQIPPVRERPAKKSAALA